MRAARWWYASTTVPSLVALSYIFTVEREKNRRREREGVYRRRRVRSFCSSVAPFLFLSIVVSLLLLALRREYVVGSFISAGTGTRFRENVARCLVAIACLELEWERERQRVWENSRWVEDGVCMCVCLLPGWVFVWYYPGSSVDGQEVRIEKFGGLGVYFMVVCWWRMVFLFLGMFMNVDMCWVRFEVRVLFTACVKEQCLYACFLCRIRKQPFTGNKQFDILLNNGKVTWFSKQISWPLLYLP